MCDKITVDILDYNKGWIEYWQCVKCGKLFPLYYLSCPYCDPNKGQASVTVNTINDYDTEGDKGEDRQLDC